MYPVLAAAFVAWFVWSLRERSTRANGIRTRQLALAVECLDKHAAALEQILNDPAAPTDLKKLVIAVSDAMSDRAVVEKLVEWGATRPLDPPTDTESIRAIEAVLAPLRDSRPDLVEYFGIAVVTAVVGASLRWADSAALSELMFPWLMTTPRRDVAIAATATSLRSHGPFSLRPAVAAIA